MYIHTDRHVHTGPRSKKIESHETSKRMPLGGWWGYDTSWNMHQKNIGWENFAQLTKTFGKLKNSNIFLKMEKSCKINVFAAILTW